MNLAGGAEAEMKAVMMHLERAQPLKGPEARDAAQSPPIRHLGVPGLILATIREFANPFQQVVLALGWLLVGC